MHRALVRRVRRGIVRLSTALNALVPVFLVIVLGWGLRRARFPGDGFWAPVERLTYYVFFPALLVDTLATADLNGVFSSGLVPALFAAITLMGLGVVTAALLLGVDGPRLSSAFQGAIRFNTYVFLAAAAAAFGSRGLALGAVCVAFLVPIINLYCVSLLAWLGRPARASGWWAGILGNPLIIACVAGILLNASGARMPSTAASLVDILAQAALPLGLLAVGAALDPARARASGAMVASTTIAKLVALPLLGYAACSLLGVDALARNVGVLWCAMPTATSSYILARQLGGDAPLMAGMVTMSHLAGCATLPVVLWLLVG